MTAELYCSIAQRAYAPEPLAEELPSLFQDISGIQHVYFFDAKKKGTGASDAQMYTLICEDRVIFACRGTESLSDVKTDIQFLKTPFQDLIYCNQVDTQKYKNIQVHKGFLNQFNTLKFSIMSTLFAQLWKSTQRRTVVFASHSLGAALSILGAACIKAFFGDAFRVECHTFGAPRVGNTDFVRYFDDTVDVSIRYVNGADIVTAIPKFRYKHVKGETRIGSQPTLCTRVWGSAKDHLLKQYQASLKQIHPETGDPDPVVDA